MPKPFTKGGVGYSPGTVLSWVYEEMEANLLRVGLYDEDGNSMVGAFKNIENTLKNILAELDNSYGDEAFYYGKKFELAPGQTKTYEFFNHEYIGGISEKENKSHDFGTATTVYQPFNLAGDKLIEMVSIKAGVDMDSLVSAVLDGFTYADKTALTAVWKTKYNQGKKLDYNVVDGTSLIELEQMEILNTVAYRELAAPLSLEEDAVFYLKLGTNHKGLQLRFVIEDGDGNVAGIEFGFKGTKAADETFELKLSDFKNYTVYDVDITDITEIGFQVIEHYNSAYVLLDEISYVSGFATTGKLEIFSITADPFAPGTAEEITEAGETEVLFNVAFPSVINIPVKADLLAGDYALRITMNDTVEFVLFGGDSLVGDQIAFQTTSDDITFTESTVSLFHHIYSLVESHIGSVKFFADNNFYVSISKNGFAVVNSCYAPDELLFTKTLKVDSDNPLKITLTNPHNHYLYIDANVKWWVQIDEILPMDE